MAAIDLLFDHREHSERVHQVALSGLLLHSRLLGKILNRPALRVQEVDWEPERGRFDLAFSVSEPEGPLTRVYVELKVDGALEKEQFDRQLSHAQSHGPTAHVLYLVLGLSQVTVTDDQLRKWAQTEDRRALIHRCDAQQLIDKLADPQIQPPQSDPHQRDVRDLASAYRDVLLRLIARTEHYADRIPRSWQPADFYGFFAECRSKPESQMAKAGISYEANPKGGFIACNWMWTPIHPTEHLRLYLQMEDQKLCLKLKVPDEHKTQRKKLWDKAQEALRAVASSETQLVPGNYHSGIHTTFASISDVFGDGPLDRARFKKTVEKAEQVLTAIAAELLPVATKLIPIAEVPTKNP